MAGSAPSGSSDTPESTPSDAGGRLRAPRVVATGALALALTAPGQTAGLSILIDPLIAELQVSRSAISTAYMIGTLAGALALPVVGRAIDRLGPRRMLALIAALFGGVLVTISAVSNIIGLTAAFIGLRMFGQGALSLVATTAVAIYVEKRRGLAQGLASAFGAAGISLTPVLLESFAATHGFRTVWLAQGLVIWAVAIPLALIGLPRRTPVDVRNDEAAAKISGAPAKGGLLGRRNQPVVTAPGDWTVREATRTALFWVVTAAVAAVAMLATGVNFHQIALLGERGLTPAEAALNFLPQTLAGLGSTVLMGALADRLAPRVIMVLCMASLAGAMAAGGYVQPGWTAIAFGLALGVAGNGLRVLEATAFPNTFGLSHVGAIRGMMTSMTVGSSALGPLALAAGHDWLGSYRPVLLILTTIPVGVGIAAAFTKPPQPKLPPPVPDAHDPGSDLEPDGDLDPARAQTPTGPSTRAG